MTRIWAYILLFLGVFLLVLAAAVKFVVAPAAVKAPLTIPSKYALVLASGQNFNFFDSTVGKNVRINVWITRTIQGDAFSGNSSVAVYDESLCLTRDTNNSRPGCVSKADPQHRLITNSTDRVAFDRKTGMAVNNPKYHANVDGDQNITHIGLGYKFPIDTERKTYPYFDTVVHKAFPMNYAGEDTVDGLTVYRFVQKMVNEPVYTNNTFPSTYTNTRTVWVEPTTGVIVKGREQLTQTLTGKANLDPSSPVVEPKLAGIVALQGTLQFTPETVSLQAQLAKDNLPKIHLVRLWIPLIALIVGVLSLAAAVLLFRRGPRGGGDGSDEDVGRPRPLENQPQDWRPTYDEERVESSQT
jgi:hypothetical protein